jgi:hypothetical protein
MIGAPAVVLVNSTGIRNLVVVSAPFGPRKPVIFPGCSVPVKSATARTGP